MVGKRTVLGIFFVVLAYYFTKNTRVKISGKLVNTNSGVVKGIISESRDGREYYEWLGIPYAQPPLGQLRFATPQPVEQWKGVRDASEYGSECAQFDMLLMMIRGVEDCLFLNIHVPKMSKNEGKLLPVMFFIHGGYFAGGSANTHRPDYFMDEDVVLVTINYRVGALGFFNTGDKIVRGNMGLKDQSLALKWIKANIENFGGDANHITIFGESAGGASVHYHLLSPMSTGLMHKAISQSGTAMVVWAYYDDPVGQAKRFAGNLNCPTDNSEVMVECLRNKEVHDFLEAHRETLDFHHKKEAIFVPTKETVIDEETFLPDDPMVLLRAGKVAQVPWLSGGNANEGVISGQVFYKNITFREAIAENWDIIDDTFLLIEENQKVHSKTIREFYFGDDVEIRIDSTEQFTPLSNLITDRLFWTGIHGAAKEHSKHAPVYLYYYNKRGPSLVDLLLMFQGRFSPLIEILLGTIKNYIYYDLLGRPRENFGVCHADELAMLFHMPRIFHVAHDNPHYQFSKDMISTWVAFASGNEDVKFRGTKTGPAKSNATLNYLEISDYPQVVPLPIEDRLKFWEKLGK